MLNLQALLSFFERFVPDNKREHIMTKRGKKVGSVGKRKATKFTGVYLSPKSGKFIIKFKFPKSGRYRELLLDGVTDPEEAALI